jgi:hypothetical protein
MSRWWLTACRRPFPAGGAMKEKVARVEAARHPDGRCLEDRRDQARAGAQNPNTFPTKHHTKTTSQVVPEPAYQ